MISNVISKIGKMSIASFDEKGIILLILVKYSLNRWLLWQQGNAYTGCPKKVHKFEIKNLCSEVRSINKVDVICQTSPQLRF